MNDMIYNQASGTSYMNTDKLCAFSETQSQTGQAGRGAVGSKEVAGRWAGIRRQATAALPCPSSLGGRP